MRKSPDFQRVQRGGAKWRGRCLLVLHSANGLAGPRIGLVVSRKVGNAVVRNRVKRWLRESARREMSVLTGVDVVLIARGAAAGAGLGAIDADIRRAVHVIRQEYA